MSKKTTTDEITRAVEAIEKAKQKIKERIEGKK